MSEMGFKTFMKKGLFFDLYGTLINIRTDENDPWVYEMLSRYLSYHYVNIPPDELKKSFFEGIQQYLSSSKETYPEVDVYKVFFDIMNRYGKKKYTKSIVVDITMLFRALTIRQFGVFEGLYDTIANLNTKYSTAIISDAQWVFAEPEIAILGLDQFFKLRLLSSRFGYKKPDTRLFQLAMEKLGVSPQDSVYIGDNPYKDLPAAKKAGMKFILFSNECKEYNGYKPDECFNSYYELDNILRKVLK